MKNTANLHKDLETLPDKRKQEILRSTHTLLKQNSKYDENTFKKII
jgi:hypothetical protein